MGAIFCAVSHSHSSPHLPLHMLDPWIPIQAESTWNWVHHTQHVSMRVWQTHAESARGNYMAWTSQSDSHIHSPHSSPIYNHLTEHGSASTHASTHHDHQVYTETKGDACFVYTGWIRENDDDSLTESISHHLLNECLQQDHQQDQQSNHRTLIEYMKRKSGQFAGLYITPQAEIIGFHDEFCGQHLYVGSQNGEVVFSNRASLIATYFNQAHSIPPPHMESLIWHVSRHESPLGDSHSAWPCAHLSFASDSYIAHKGILSNPWHLKPEITSHSWEDLLNALIDRAKQIKRLPDVRFNFPLTGGLDSRLILGALLASDTLSHVDLIWILGIEEQADVRSARKVAEDYQLPLNVHTPQTQHLQQEPFLARVKRHLFHVEHMVNAWDLKTTSTDLYLEPLGTLPGHYGELYKGHALPVLSWNQTLLRKVYASTIYMDRHQLLTQKSIQSCIKRGLNWMDKQVQNGVTSIHMLDELHKEARMCRWVSQTQMFEGLGFPSINLLTDINIRAKYNTLSLRERQKARVHFELTRRIDDRLWTIPYADYQWPDQWVKALQLPQDLLPQAPCGGKGGEVSAQMQMWARESHEIIDFILSPSQVSEFYHYFDREKIHKKVKRTQAKPHPQAVKGLLGLAAIKMGVESPLLAYPLRRHP